MSHVFSLVSFTGADDHTPLERLVQLQAEHPIIEWALLYFPERDGKNRNPTQPWREKFHAQRLRSAFHLCGSGINEFASGHVPLMHEIENFQRIQINLKPHYANESLVQALVRQCERFPHIQFITQHNESNQAYLAMWQALKNHAFLFDASLGKGVSPGEWPRPVAGKDCGYAGGLGPHNMAHELARISSVLSGRDLRYRVWLDMESAIRTDDRLDLDKVQMVLAHVRQYHAAAG